MPNQQLFWADSVAEKILNRKRFHYTSDPVPKMNEFTVKTSASLSGVLHIGRLSDTIRGESVCRALADAGAKSRLIWVAEDMDPLRKVPEGVPRRYSEYIGMPVTDVPDPGGCHRSYAEHHVSRYFEVLGEFVSIKMNKYSMREEYRKGNFNPYIKKILESTGTLMDIQNRHRRSPLGRGWSPWQPVCENCGKIITPRVTRFESGEVHYECRDYQFESATAKGCGYKGASNPLRGNGKLVWKSEWASQWARWRVVSEGAGKEYQVPGSAWWINGEIVEKILGFPMPEPIFYEHIMIDNQKMSASKGNVIYPSDWLEVAPPEILRFFYNKKLMKTRSFSWDYLPNLYDDYKRHEDVFFEKAKLDNKREEKHMKRLYELSRLAGSKPLPEIPFEFAVMVSQAFPEDSEKAIEIFRRTGHLKGRPAKRESERIAKILEYARNWARKHAPEKYRIRVTDTPEKSKVRMLALPQKKALSLLLEELKKPGASEEKLYSSFWEISKKAGIPAPKFFEAAYLVILGRESGPRLAPLIMALGQERVAKILEQI